MAKRVGDLDVPSPDFISTVLDSFQQKFGRLNLGPVDYDVVVRWSQTDMPSTIPIRAIEEAAAKCNPAKALRFKLQWLTADVDEAYTEWRRMLGPYRASKTQELTS
jgi:hypothetical protein